MFSHTIVGIPTSPIPTIQFNSTVMCTRPRGFLPREVLLLGVGGGEPHVELGEDGQDWVGRQRRVVLDAGREGGGEGVGGGGLLNPGAVAIAVSVAGCSVLVQVVVELQPGDFSLLGYCDKRSYVVQ